MAQCTAPVEGHRTASGIANCPVCRYGSQRTYYQPPSTYAPARPVRSDKVFPSFASSSPSSENVNRSSSRSRRLSMSYSLEEYKTLSPVRNKVLEENRNSTHTSKDLFLCHSWHDRQGIALDLYDLLESLEVSVWFSEMHVSLGTPLIRMIDKGLANSKAGIVLVTPSLFDSVNSDGIAAQELSALLATDRVIPIVHDTTFEELRRVSPLLAARSGLSTASYSSLDEVATKIADTVLIN